MLFPFRYLEMSTIAMNRGCRIESGPAQTAIVFVAATAFNLPRWFEYEYRYEVDVANATLDDNVTVVEVNETVLTVDTTALRQDDRYIR